MNALRIFARLIATVLAIGASTVALALVSIDQVAGSAESLAHTVDAVVASDKGSLALGAMLVDKVLDDKSLTASKVSVDKDKLSAAAAHGLQDSREAIQSAVQDMYKANDAGIAATIDVRPVFNAVLARMHEVEPKIPATLPKNKKESPGLISVQPTVSNSGKSNISQVRHVVGMWPQAGLLALALLAAAGLLSPHRGLRKLRAPGLLIALNGVAWLIVAKAAFGLAVSKATAGHTHDLASTVASQSFGRILSVAGVCIAAGALAFGLSYRSSSQSSTPQSDLGEIIVEESSEPHQESPE